MKPIVLTILGGAAVLLLISRSNPNKTLTGIGLKKIVQEQSWKHIPACRSLTKKQKAGYPEIGIFELNTF